MSNQHNQSSLIWLLIILQLGLNHKIDKFFNEVDSAIIIIGLTLRKTDLIMRLRLHYPF